MRTSAIIKIITNLVLAIFLIALLTSLLGGNSLKGLKIPALSFGGFNYKFDNASKYSIADGKTSADDIKKINIDWVSGKIRIEEYSGSKIEFYEESSSNLSEDNKMRYMIDGGTLKIKFKKPYFGFGLFKSLNKTLVVRIPISMEDGLSEFKIDNVSASVDIEALIANDVSLNSISGDMRVKNLISKKLDIETVSGTMNISAKTEFFDAESVSGSLKIDIDSASIEKIDVEAVSGDISLILGSSPKKLDIETVSGDVDVTLPENDGFAVKYDSVSGKFRCDFEVSITKKEAVYKDGKSKSSLDIETVSGDININRK